MNLFPGSQNTRIDNFVTYQVHGGLYHGSSLSAEQRNISDILQPITDASHTRDRKRSPPDSACFPGTRQHVVRKVNRWARSDVTTDSEPHIRWMHGYVGCGKSSISQEVCDTSEREDRSVISFFFFRNAGDRSKIWRLATTLASQMLSAVPETEPFIRAAVDANPALLRTEGGVSLRARMQRLVYAPFKAAIQGEKPIGALARGPFLIVLDGLDECDNKDEIQELIGGMLLFFDDNPLIPLRVFITSRVEEHIQSVLDDPRVQLDNLVDHCSDDDIATFLHILFKDGCRRNSVVRAYIRQHGEWPTESNKRKLVEHIGGSFIFASAVFKFIMGKNMEGDDRTTPMDRLPLALKMNPGLDGLYTQTLARSMRLPYFSDIISTIALLQVPLSTSGVAELLGIHTYEVVNVLVNLQAIIQVPGTDEIPVTLCHTSLRDFLTTESRSGSFFAHPSHHARLFLRCLECELKLLRQQPGSSTPSSGPASAVESYTLRYSVDHLNGGRGCFKLSETDSAIQLCREALALQPGSPKLIGALADVLDHRASQTGSLMDFSEAISLYRQAFQLRSLSYKHSEPFTSLAGALLRHYLVIGAMDYLEEAIPLYREALELQPFPHPGRPISLTCLGSALLYRHQRTRTMADLEEAILLHYEALELRSPRHPDRSASLTHLGSALMARHQRAGTMADLEEAIVLYREALELQPPPNPDRSISLSRFGTALFYRHQRTCSMGDLEEAISLHREALELRPSPHPFRSASLCDLAKSSHSMYNVTNTLSHLQEAIAHCEELLEFHYTAGHQARAEWLLQLGSFLQMRFDATGQAEDLTKIASLREEADRLSAASPEPAT